MPRSTEPLSVFRPLGLLASGSPPAAQETLTTAFAVRYRVSRAELPSTRKPLSATALARALPKSSTIRGDIVIRETTGDVFLRTTRKRDSFVHEGSVLAWLGWPQPGVEPIKVDLTLDPALGKTYRTRYGSDAEHPLLAVPGNPVRFTRHGLVSLAIDLIDLCGRLRCNDQRVNLVPAAILTLTPRAHASAA